LVTALSTTGSTANMTAAYGGRTSPNFVITLQAGTPIPIATPAAGSFGGAQTITLSSTDGAAVIHYTTNGTTPTSASPVYTAPFVVASTQTVKAIGINGSYTSAPGSFLYTIGSACTPHVILSAANIVAVLQSGTVSIPVVCQ
jgi:hypothetical protein